MAKPSFNDIWNRIVALQGESFTTKTSLPLTYIVDGDAVIPSRTDYSISRQDFEKAFNLVPLSGPGKINELVRGPAYIWAILYDHRISDGEW